MLPYSIGSNSGGSRIRSSHRRSFVLADADRGTNDYDRSSRPIHKALTKAFEYSSQNLICYGVSIYA